MQCWCCWWCWLHAVDVAVADDDDVANTDVAVADTDYVVDADDAVDVALADADANLITLVPMKQHMSERTHVAWTTPFFY